MDTIYNNIMDNKVHEVGSSKMKQKHKSAIYNDVKSRSTKKQRMMEEEDNETITDLAKKLKIKNKEKAPLAFENDGLDYILDVVDHPNMLCSNPGNFYIS